MDKILDWFDALWNEAIAIWVAGAWAMWAIAVVAVVMIGTGLHLWLSLRAKRFRAIPEETWRYWIVRPDERQGRIGEILDFVTGGKDIKETSFFFTQLRQSETAPFERDFRIMKVCVSAAPLVGLLGTVTGMLATFAALSAGSGGDKTMGLVAEGISEALITTETGLVVALPGLFFQYHLTRGFERYKAFLAHVETVCTQVLHRRKREELTRAAERVAKQQVARILHRAVT